MSVLPPTVNAFTPQQRIRLIRSTRKVGALLGTTPQVVEDDFLAERAHRRDGMLFPHSHNNSIASFHESSDGQTATSASISFRLIAQPPTPTTAKASKPPALVLSVQPQGLPAHPASLPSGSVSPRSPLSPSFLNASGGENSTAIFRRRKMEKLARTLGENVPPELVFPNLPSSEHTLPPPIIEESRKAHRTSRGRSWSVDTEASSAELLRNNISATSSQTRLPSLRTATHMHQNPSLASFHTFNTSSSTIHSGSRPESIAFSTTCVPSEMNEVYGPGLATAKPYSSFTGGVQMDRTFSPTGSISSLQSLQPMQVKRRPSLTQMLTRSTSVRLRSNTVTAKKHNLSSGKRSESGWTGEWNQDDMEQVVNKLRNLKAK